MSLEREERLTELEARVAELEAQVEEHGAALRVVVDHMERCPERGGPLSWRCIGMGRIVGHGKRCTPGRRL